MMQVCSRVSRSLLFAGLLLGLAAAPGTTLAAPPAKVKVLITFKKYPGKTQKTLVENNGGKISHQHVIVPTISAELTPAAITALSKHKDIDFIEPDGMVQAVDAELDSVWGVKRIGSGFAHSSNPAINGAGINIAILDTGIDYTHADLAANYRGGYDFVNRDNDPRDDNGHGTHVAGTIAAADNDTGVVGVAPKANIYALKVLDANGSGYFSNMIAALDWCVTNQVRIDITNHSYGSPGNPGSTVQQAFDNAYNFGILNIGAAGNNGTSAGTEDNVIYPARFASVLAVGATNGSDVRAYFSCTGQNVDVAAPGDYILSTVPGGYAYYSGTSMACPHAVGTAALYLQAARDFWGASAPDNDYVWNIMTISARDLGTAGWDTWYGWGLLDVPAGITAVTQIAPTGPTSPPPPPVAEPAKTLSVSGFTYKLSGRRKTDLTITISVVDNTGVAVSGASVNARISCSGVSTIYGGTASTDSTGKVSFKITNAPKGTWTTTVQDVSKAGYDWDGSKKSSTYQRN